MQKDFIEFEKIEVPEGNAKKSNAVRYAWMSVFFLILAVCVFFAYAIFAPRSFFNGTTVNFRIEKGEVAQVIGERLKSAGIIRYSGFFDIYARLSKKAHLIQFGNYAISSEMSIYELLNIFSSKGSPDEINIKIIEGWTIKDIAKYLDGKGVFSAYDFLEAVEENFNDKFNFVGDIPRFDGSRLDVKYFYLQGFLFPDTYRVFKDASPKDVINKMLDNFNVKFTKAMRDEIVLQKKTAHQIITMASLLEREVRTPEDKVMVSGILWKRLQLKMPLQVDATIVFAKTNGFGKLDNGQKIYFDDLKIKSAYNTYANAGLPPGPIANPGLESIEAALYPKTSPYLYYLSASDGKTIFSKTLDEHNRNKAKYLTK